MLKNNIFQYLLWKFAMPNMLKTVINIYIIKKLQNHSKEQQCLL